MMSKVKSSLESLLKKVDYTFLNTRYRPSVAAIAFVNFIKLVNGARGEENKSPVMHMDMVDRANAFDNNLYVAFRGSAKTSALHEYMFLFLGVYGEFFDFGKVDVAMYVSDTIDNGIKSMRKNLQFRYENSEFLQEYIPVAKFTDVRWEFTNLEGHNFCVRGFGASTGVRGFKEYGQRPSWCGLDDLMSDKNAGSPTIIEDMRKIIYRAVRAAMHPDKRKVIWTGTPFNQGDPLYTATGSKAWATAVYPICEEYPCTKEQFRGAWEDRFPYEFVKKEYELLLEAGEIAAFNQELMLRIMSDEDRLVQEEDIQYYSRDSMLKKISSYNIYITTDFATGEEDANDFSVISVWAINHAGHWFWVDGICKKQLMNKNIDDLFRLAQKWKTNLQEVGIEVSGQQQGFVSIIESMMVDKNIFFNLASDNNSNKAGIRPLQGTKKIGRFNTVLPWFKTKRMHFPEELLGYAPMLECMNELRLIAKKGSKSVHDDFIDTISMLSVLNVWRPSDDSVTLKQNTNGLWKDDDDDDDDYSINSYVV